MATIINPSLFSWNDVEARSALDRFYLVRDNLPNEKIVMELEDRRGKGRDEFPVRAIRLARAFLRRPGGPPSPAKNGTAQIPQAVKTLDEKCLM